MKNLFILLFILFSSSSFAQFDTVSCDVYGYADSPPEWNATAWYLNNAMQDYNGCGMNPSIHVGVIDADSCESWGTYNCASSGGGCSSCVMINYDHQFGNANNGCGTCRNRVEKFFVFRLNEPNSMAYLDTMLTNPMLSGHKLLLYTFITTDFSYLNSNCPNTVQILENLGFDSVSLYSGEHPFIFFTEVGNPSSAIQVYGQDSNSFISMTAIYDACGNFTSITENEQYNSIYPTLLQNGNFIHVNYDEIEIYDMSGKLQKYHYQKGDKFFIDGFDAGIYFLKIKRGNGFVVEKIVVTD